MFCNNCGQAVPDGARFCNSCGADTSANALTQPQKKPKWESHTQQCHPDYENQTIKIYEGFGWEVQSRQEIYSKNSHIEGHFDGNYSVTETTNYVKITFRRDQNMPNYQRIAQLEAEYDAAMNSYPVKPGKGFLYLGLATLIFYGLGAIAIGYYIYKLFAYQKEYHRHDAMANEVARRTLSEAAQLLD